MKILAIDTSTPTGSVAVVDDDHLLAEINSGMARTHARQVLPMVDMALKLSASELADVGLLAVVKGPGTFTGLRIGAAVVKGLASVCGKPIAGVSALEALAWQAGLKDFLVCSLIDARRGDVYAALYTCSDGRLSQVFPETVAPPDQVLAAITAPCLLVGSGALVYRELIRARLGRHAHFAPAGQHTIHASTVARLGFLALHEGRVDNAASLTPTYLRKTDAELKLKSI